MSNRHLLNTYKSEDFFICMLFFKISSFDYDIFELNVVYKYFDCIK